MFIGVTFQSELRGNIKFSLIDFLATQNPCHHVDD